MKRIVSIAVLVVVTVGMLGGCIHLKEFTQEELDLISLNGAPAVHATV